MECFKLSQVDLVFGPKPQKAFAALDEGKDREAIRKETQQLVGVQGVSLSVFEGEILVIMGLSGSGKSSLLRCLNGMNGRGVGKLRGQIVHRDLTSGKLTDLKTCTRLELRNLRRHQIAMVFQQFGLMPWRSVLENTAYPLEVQGVSKQERRERALEKLELVGLANWKDRYPHELSGGMQQRVGLARAFVTQAPILLMDEPFSALDPLHRKHLQDEVLRLQEKLKKTIVFVTHDFNEAARVASRVAIMDSGRILQLSTPKEVISHPACPKVRQFTEALAV